MIDIFKKLCNTIEVQSEYFDLFIKFRMRFEGWLEAEFINILDSLDNVDIISTKKKFRNESRRPDLVLKINEDIILVEIKTCLIEESPKPRNLGFYFHDQLIKDFNNISNSSEKEYALICFNPCDGDDIKYISYISEVQEKFNIKKIDEYKLITQKGNNVTFCLLSK